MFADTLEKCIIEYSNIRPYYIDKFYEQKTRLIDYDMIKDMIISKSDYA